MTCVIAQTRIDNEEQLVRNTFDNIRHVYEQHQAVVIAKLKELIRGGWDVLYDFEKNFDNLDAYLGRQSPLVGEYFQFIEGVEMDGEWLIDQYLIGLENYIETTIDLSRADSNVPIALRRLHNIRHRWNQDLDARLLAHQNEVSLLAVNGFTNVWQCLDSSMSAVTMLQGYWRNRSFNSASQLEDALLDLDIQRQQQVYERFARMELEYEQTIAELFDAEDRYYQ